MVQLFFFVKTNFFRKYVTSINPPIFPFKSHQDIRPIALNTTQTFHSVPFIAAIFRSSSQLFPNISYYNTLQLTHLMTKYQAFRTYCSSICNYNQIERLINLYLPVNKQEIFSTATQVYVNFKLRKIPKWNIEPKIGYTEKEIYILLMLEWYLIWALTFKYFAIQRLSMSL